MEVLVVDEAVHVGVVEVASVQLFKCTFTFEISPITVRYIGLCVSIIVTCCVLNANMGNLHGIPFIVQDCRFHYDKSDPYLFQ